MLILLGSLSIDGTHVGVAGQFCGRELPGGGTISTTQNHIYLWFQSDSSVNGDGFSFTWNSAAPGQGTSQRNRNACVLHVCRPIRKKQDVEVTQAGSACVVHVFSVMKC